MEKEIIMVQLTDLAFQENIPINPQKEVINNHWMAKMLFENSTNDGMLI